MLAQDVVDNKRYVIPVCGNILSLRNKKDSVKVDLRMNLSNAECLCFLRFVTKAM